MFLKQENLNLMQELSRIIIENYCLTHSSTKSRRLQKLVELSYDDSAVASDSDAIFLEKLIDSEKHPEMKEALEDLNDFLFNY